MVTSINRVCPPEMMSAMWGGTVVACRKGESRCPSRWLTAIKGLRIASAMALAAVLPIRSDEASPGPAVAAKASIWSIPSPAFLKATSTSGRSTSEWFRDASSGTTPP